MNFAAFQEFNRRGMNRRPEEASRMFRFREDIMNDLWRNHYNDEFEWPEQHGDERLKQGEEYERTKKALEERGIKVRANVTISNYDPQKPMLMIDVRRLNTPGNPEWVSDAPPGSEYHVTVGPMNDIIRNIPNWRHEVETLFIKFDNANLWLLPDRVTNGHTLALSKCDPIASDETFQLLHQTDIRYNKRVDRNRNPILDANGQEIWDPVVPQAHVSM